MAEVTLDCSLLLDVALFRLVKVSLGCSAQVVRVCEGKLNFQYIPDIDTVFTETSVFSPEGCPSRICICWCFLFIY